MPRMPKVNKCTHEARRKNERNKEVRKQASEFRSFPLTLILSGHCTPRTLPQDDCIILQGESTRRERGNLYFLSFDEIASVVSLPRNDIVTQPLRREAETRNLLLITPVLALQFFVRIPQSEIETCVDAMAHPLCANRSSDRVLCFFFCNAFSNHPTCGSVRASNSGI